LFYRALRSRWRAIAFFRNVKDFVDIQFLEGLNLVLAFDLETVEEKGMGEPVQFKLNKYAGSQSIYCNSLCFHIGFGLGCLNQPLV